MSPPQFSPQRVLVLCTGNSARSIIAEALFLAIGNGAFHVSSAGSAPTGVVHPLALQNIKGLPVDLQRFRSKSIASAIAESPEPFDCVITVCDQAAESCGLVPGRPRRIHWGLADPASLNDPDEARQAFEECFAELKQRITELIQSGGVQGCDVC